MAALSVKRPVGSIRARILAAFGLSVVAFSAALCFGLLQLWDLGARLSALDSGYLPLAEVAVQLETIAGQMDRDQDRYAREDERSLVRYRSTTLLYTSSLGDAVARGQQVASSAAAAVRAPDEKASLAELSDLLKEIEASRADYAEAFGTWADAVAAGTDTPGRALAELDGKRTVLKFQVEVLAQRVERRVQEVSARAARAQGRALGVGVTLALLAVLLSGLLLFASLLTLRPIGQLTAQVQRLAQGDRVGRVQVRSSDEVSLLAREFNAMAEAVAERDRRLVERAEALDALSLRLRQVLDTIRAGLVVVEDEHAETTNPAATQLWGLREGEPLPDFLLALPAGRHEARPVGSRLFDIDVVPFGTGALVVGEDVTERIRNRDRLARSERLAVVGQMLAQITHEVRNPLNAMSLNAELLLEDLSGTEHADLLGTITQEIGRLEGLTARYLELSRGRRAELSPANALDLVRDVARVEGPALLRRGVQITVEGVPTAVVEMDVDALRRALRNLLLNAAEAGATEIGISLDQDSDAVTVAVDDDGPGMDAAQMARIFEPFYTTKAQGTGLGLAITRQELEDVGGTIAVAAGARGGCRFTVVLPIEANPELREA